MALAISDDHKALADVVRGFAAANDLRALARKAVDGAGSGPDPVYKQMAELGWLGLHVPEEHGGSGSGWPKSPSWPRAWARWWHLGRSCRVSPPPL